MATQNHLKQSDLEKSLDPNIHFSGRQFYAWVQWRTNQHLRTLLVTILNAKMASFNITTCMAFQYPGVCPLSSAYVQVMSTLHTSSRGFCDCSAKFLHLCVNQTRFADVHASLTILC
jgi:hypothetical protein